jgi:rare lipoprotein A
MKPALAALLAMILLCSGCGRRRNDRLARPAAAPVGLTETGVASWYGHPYHGRQSASGETYDMEQLTAAHRTLPFGTWVDVLNLKNDKRVAVRINDRGPFLDGRIIDLSRAAARAIDMIGPGIVPVRVRVISAPAEPAAGTFAVQVGAFRELHNAERLRREMEQRYGAARLVRREGDPGIWRVLVGLERTPEGAGALAERIRKDRGGRSAAFVVRIDSV